MKFMHSRLSPAGLTRGFFFVERSFAWTQALRHCALYAPATTDDSYSFFYQGVYEVDGAIL